MLGLEVDAPFEKGIAPALLMEKYIYIYTVMRINDKYFLIDIYIVVTCMSLHPWGFTKSSFIDDP